MTPHELNVLIHVSMGATALLIGLIPLITAKGGATHRSAGRVFVALGAVVLGTAMIANVLFDPPPALIAATGTAGYQYISSLRALSNRNGPGWIDALLALAALGGCAALYTIMQTGTQSWPPALGYATMGFLSFFALYDLSRHFWRATWIAHVRPIDHGVKMTGAYFAMMSAGAGNVLRDFQPWSQFGPSLLGLVVMLALLIAYFARGNRPAF